MAAYDNVSLPGPPDIAHAGNYADMLMRGLSNVGESYQKGQDFRYKQRQQDLFKDGLPTDANGQPDYGAMLKQVLQSGGAPALGQIGTLQRQPLIDLLRSRTQGGW